jgi:hypothetical protein
VKRILILSLALAGLACGSSRQLPSGSPDGAGLETGVTADAAIDAPTPAGGDAGPVPPDTATPGDAAPTDAQIDGLEAGPDAVACEPGVTAEDCARCGPIGDNPCNAGSFSPCHEDPGDPWFCCRRTLGRYCSCSNGVWQQTICDTPPDAAGE